ncbi:MAG: penicillin-binding transpeptidase domain-containing protein [Acidobacteriota bacterium]
MLKKTESIIISLVAIVALLVIGAGNFTLFSSCAMVSRVENSLTNNTDLAVSPCANALAQHAVCVAANKQALEIMNANQLEAITVVQDVATGALVAFAASQPSKLDVNTPVLPLSLCKLLLCASWWDNQQPNSSFNSTKGTAKAKNPAYRSRVSVHEILVGGSDSAGRQMAIALRKAVGTKAMLKDFKRYGFAERSDLPRNDTFWGELATTWETRLIPTSAYISLSDETKDMEWADTLSIGETNMSVTALHISRFLQAVGNNGVMLTPVAREEQPTSSIKKSQVSHKQLKNSTRIMQQSTALRLQSAMRDTVQRGTAKSIANALKDTGWQIGGKTGTGPGPMPIGPQSDGWFAGLIFDSQGKARFTIATFVKHGGPGGGNAAKISVELARYITRFS